MSADFIPGLPELDEYPPFAEGYISRARGFNDPVAALEAQLMELMGMLHAVHPEFHMYSYAPGKWTLKEVVGHITDAERIFASRLLRIARGDDTPLPPFEQDDYVAGAQSNQCTWDNLLGEFEHLRASNILMIRNFPHEAWQRRGTVSGNPASTRGLAYLMIGHVASHIEILNERYFPHFH